MLKLSKDAYIDVDRYAERLQGVPFIAIDTDVIDNIRRYNLNTQNTLYNLVINTMATNSGNRCNSLDKHVIAEYLIYFEGVPDNRIGKTPTGAISLDINKYLKPLYEDGYAEEFLGLYLQYRKIKKYNEDMNKLVSEWYIPVDSEHRNLKKCTFNVTERDNLRFFYSDVNIVNIPKIYNSAIKPPPGYVLVAGDFEQSDFRIAYNILLKDEENLKIMNSVEDKYEGMARIIAKSLGEEFDLDKFKAERDLMKVNILGPMYGKNFSRSFKSQKFITRMQDFLKHCPKYQKFKENLFRRLQLSLPITVETYFGTEIPISTSIGDKGEMGPLNKALNTPIQTGTSEIMILLVNGILDRFAELGYKEGEDFGMYYARHDEALFIIKEELMHESWVFKDFSKIIVDDWTPLGIEFTFHRNYEEPDEDLMEQYKKSIIQNRFRIKEVEPSNTHYEHSLIKDVTEIAVYTVSLANKTVVCFYNMNLNKAFYRLYNGTRYEDISNQIQIDVTAKFRDILDNNSNCALVVTDYERKDIHYGNVLFKFLDVEGCTSRGTAKILCENMAKRYANKNGLEFRPSTSLQEFADLIRSVGDWDERQN